ncbi:MAG: hypothetical protein KGM49_16040, partial [Sphingomonadales bacterium]|nr:hypothetical protein [Sphingomonadales bacterium]
MLAVKRHRQLGGEDGQVSARMRAVQVQKLHRHIEARLRLDPLPGVGAVELAPDAGATRAIQCANADAPAAISTFSVWFILAKKLETRSAVFAPLSQLTQAANSMLLGRKRPWKKVVGGVCSFLTGVLPQYTHGGSLPRVSILWRLIFFAYRHNRVREDDVDYAAPVRSIAFALDAIADLGAGVQTGL